MTAAGRASWRGTVLALLAAVGLLLCTASDCDAPAGQNASTGKGGEGGSVAGAPVVVWVEDSTGAAYPVRQAVAVWAAALRPAGVVDVRYGRCAEPGRCVRVRQRDLGDDGAAGWATTQRSGDASIVMNTHYLPGYSRRFLAHLACHEIGHALGLDHRRDLTSCLYDGPQTEGLSTRPDARDIAAVNTAHRRDRGER